MTKPLPKNKKLPPRNHGGPQGNNGSQNHPNPGNGNPGNNPQGDRNVMPKGPRGNGRGNGGGNGKGGGNGGYFGGMGPYKGVPIRRVKRLVNGLLRDELNDIRRQNRMVRRQARNDTAAIRNDYNRGMGDLQYVHGEVGDALQGLISGGQAQYQNTLGQQQAASMALQQQLGNTYTGAMDAQTAEMERLGIGGGVNNSQMISELATQQGAGAQAGASMQNLMGMGQQFHNNQMSGLQGMNVGSYQSGVGQHNNNINDQLSEVRQNKTDQLNQILEAMTDIKGSRRDLFFQMLNQLQETGWGQFMDLQNLKMQKKQMRR